MSLFQVNFQGVEEKKPIVWGAASGIYTGVVMAAALKTIEGNDGSWEQIEIDLALETPTVTRMVRVKYGVEKGLGYFYNMLKMAGFPETSFKGRVFDVPDNFLGKRMYVDYTARPVDPETGKPQRGTYESFVWLTKGQYDNAVRSGHAVTGAAPQASSTRIEADLGNVGSSAPAQAQAPQGQQARTQAQAPQTQQAQQTRAAAPKPAPAQDFGADDDIPF